MNGNDLDDLFRAGARPGVDPALLERITQNIGASLQPVRPLPSSRVLIAAAMMACIVLAVAGGAVLGLHGIQKLGAVEIGVIFPVLVALTGLAAAVCVTQVIPGSRRPIGLGALMWVVSLALVGVFALLFRDYHTTQFVSAGMKCLIAGTLQAVPTALAGWLIFRRGYAVNRLAAGLSVGVLAGLAGVTMLELHCPNFQTWHVIVWHTAVVPVSALAAGLVARLAR